MSIPRLFAPMRNERGFTLIEMLSVIAILGVLAALVSGAISGVGNSGKTAQIEGDQHTIDTGADRFFSEAFPESYPVVSWDNSPSVLKTGLGSDTGVRLIDFDAALPGDQSKTFVPDFLKEVPSSASRVSWRLDTTTGSVFFASDAALLIRPSSSRLGVSATSNTTSAVSNHLIDLTMNKDEAAPQIIKIEVPAGYSLGGLALADETVVGTLAGTFETDNPWNPGVKTTFSGTLKATGTSNQWELAIDYPIGTRSDRSHTVQVAPPSQKAPGSMTITLASIVGDPDHNPSTENWKLTINGQIALPLTNIITNPSTAGVYRWAATEHTTIDIEGTFDSIAGNQAIVVK